MFTLKHMNKVLGEIKGLGNKSVFSLKKNRLCYSLSKLNNQHRGAIIEKMVRDRLIMQGMRVKYIGGTNSFDMLVNGQRVEIKSSLARSVCCNGKYFYSFQNIKTKNFDKIILVYISPNGLKMKTFSKKAITKILSKNKYYSNGKTYAHAA